MKSKNIFRVIFLCCILCLAMAVGLFFAPKEQGVEAATSESYFTMSGSTIVGYTGPGAGMSLQIPQTVNSVTVTAIGSNVFSGRSFSSITFPSTLISIGDSAFKSTHIYSSSLDLYNVQTIGDYAFSGAEVRNVTGNSVQTIGDYAFQNTTYLYRIYLPSVREIGSYAFLNSGDGSADFTFGSSLTTIGTRCFENNGFETINSTSNSGSFRTYNNTIFYNYSSKTILAFAFGRGNNSFYISNSSYFSSINGYACANAKFEYMSISISGFDINANAFNNADIGTLYLSSSNVYIYNYAFSSAKIANLDINTTTLMTSGSYSFNGATIDNLYIRANVNNIKSDTFCYCYINKIYISSASTTFSNSSFYIYSPTNKKYATEALILQFEETSADYYTALQTCGLTTYLASIYVPSEISFGFFNTPLEDIGFNLLMTNSSYKIYSKHSNTYSITSSAGVGGSISPAGTTSYVKESAAKYTISASTGYKTTSVLVDGVDKGALTSYTFSSITANHTISATFEKKQFTVFTSAGTGGTITPGDTVVEYGDSLTFTITPNEGYQISSVKYYNSTNLGTNLGSATDCGTASTVTIENITAHKKILATFTKIKYDVTFYNEDGSVSLLDTQVEHGSSASYTGETPTKESTPQYSYTFDYWVTEPNGSIEADLTNIKESKNFYAHFSSTIRQYTVTFYNEDEVEILATVSVEYGGTAVYPYGTPTKEATAEYTYTFSKWVTTPGGATEDKLTNVVSSRSVYASFTATKNTYTIKFVNWDSTELQSGEIEYGETPSYTGETPTRSATAEYTYTFSGWTPSIASVTKAQTYTAVFTESVNQYTITFYSEDGSSMLGKSTVDYGKTAIYPNSTPTKEATAEYTYTFSKWVTTPGGATEDKLTNVVSNRSVYASFTATKNKYTIKFVNWDSTELQSSEIEYGVTPSYTGATPTKPATAEYTYTFSGWTPSIASVTKAQTYTAVFTESVNQYTITFYSEDGGSILGKSTVDYGKTAIYPNSTPTKEATAEYTYTLHLAVGAQQLRK